MKNEKNKISHVVFGAGQVGGEVTRLLAQGGHAVRVVRRSAGPVPCGAMSTVGDAHDVQFATQAAKGADTVYLCLNASYSKWNELLPPLWRSVRLAAAAAGARLVVLDNLYALGVVAGARHEELPRRPASRKGALRARLEAELLESSSRGELEVAIGRASDFFGPGVVSSQLLHPRNLARMATGRNAEYMGDPDAPHAYAYTPDVAAALVALGTASFPVDGVWHLPVAFTGPTRALIARLSSAAGHEVDTNRVPRFVSALLGVVSPVIREAREMAYEREQPFLVDDGKFRRRFRFEGTPLDEAIQLTGRYIATFAPAANKAVSAAH